MFNPFSQSYNPFRSHIMPNAIDFYVDSVAGNDSNSGRSPSHAWATIAKVNAYSFPPGARIGLKRGQTWREALVVPGSGTEDAPITICAYDSGANPVLVGSSVQATWIAETSLKDNQDTSDSYGQLRASEFQNLLGQGITPASTYAVDHIDCYLVKVGTVGAGNIWCEIRSETAAKPGAVIATSQTIVANSISTSAGYVSFNFASVPVLTSGVKYYITLAGDWAYDAVNLIQVGRWAAASVYAGGEYWSYYSVTQTWTSNAGRDMRFKVYARTGAWYIAAASEIFGVWENSTHFLRRTDSVANVIANPGSFIWTGGNFYISPTASDNPNTNGKTYEIGRDFENISDNGKDYIVIDGIDCTRSAGTDVNSVGGVKLIGSHNVVRNVSSYEHYRHSFTFYTGCDNSTVQSCRGWNSYTTSPVACYGATTHDNLLETTLCYQDSGVSADGTLVRMHGASYNFTVQGCTLHDSRTGYALECYDADTHGLTFQYNNVYGACDYLVNIHDHATGIVIQYNWMHDIVSVHSLIILSSDIGDISILNNTISRPGSSNPVIYQSSPNVTVKNNIFVSAKYVTVLSGGEVGISYNNNLYYGGGSGRFSWLGAAYQSLATWQAASSQDAASFETNPLFVSGSYHLDTGSPAINAGANVGIAFDYDDNSVPYGDAPDIGAFERQMA